MERLNPLIDIVNNAVADLAIPHGDDKFNAVLCAGDMHGIAIASAVAMRLNLPLLVACSHQHDCVVQHSVTFGDIPMNAKFCYIDDFFMAGGSIRHAVSMVDRLSQARITYCYEASFRRSRELGQQFYVLDTTLHGEGSQQRWTICP